MEILENSLLKRNVLFFSTNSFSVQLSTGWSRKNAPFFCRLLSVNFTSYLHMIFCCTTENELTSLTIRDKIILISTCSFPIDTFLFINLISKYLLIRSLFCWTDNVQNGTQNIRWDFLCFSLLRFSIWNLYWKYIALGLFPLQDSFTRCCSHSL